LNLKAAANIPFIFLWAKQKKTKPNSQPTGRAEMYVLIFMPKGRRIFMKKSKRILALLLSVLTILGTLFSSTMTASAADIHVKMLNPGTEWDEATASPLWNEGRVSGSSNFFILYISSDQMLYCIEPGKPLSGGEGLDINDYVNAMHTPSISEDLIVSKLLGRLFQYVDYDTTGSPLDTDEGKALYIAVQILVWETTQGERDMDFNYVAPPSGYDPVRQAVDNSAMPIAHKNMIIACYDDLVKKVQNHHKIPTFTRMSQSNAPTYELTDNGGTLSVKLTDNNGVMSCYDFSANSGNLSFSKSGNTLTVTSPGGFDGEIIITATSNNIQRKGVVCYGDGAAGRQDTVSVGSPIDDPVRAYFKVKAAVGNLSIVKTSKNNDGLVGGFMFEIKKGNTNKRNQIRTFAEKPDVRDNSNISNNEKRFDHERDNLHGGERVSDTRPDTARGIGRDYGAGRWQIRPKTSGVSEKPQTGAVHRPADDLHSEPALSGNRTDGAEPHGADGVADGGGTGLDGGTQTGESNVLGYPFIRNNNFQTVINSHTEAVLCTLFIGWLLNLKGFLFIRAQFDIDSGTVNVWFPNGAAISILCNEIEDSMNLTVRQRSEFDRLIYATHLNL
jgi:hypothetical protein